MASVLQNPPLFKACLRQREADLYGFYLNRNKELAHFSFLWYDIFVRGISAVGSAFEWHSKGRGFESHMLHEGKSPENTGIICKCRVFRGFYYIEKHMNQEVHK